MLLYRPSLHRCVRLWEEVAPEPHCTVAITENLSASISTFSHIPLYRQQRAALCAVQVLSNPHSRNVRAASRFSPTRFIPLAAPAEMTPQLDYFQALGIKRYTFGGRQ